MCKALQLSKKFPGFLIFFIQVLGEKRKNSETYTTLATESHRGGPVLRALVTIDLLMVF